MKLLQSYIHIALLLLASSISAQRLLVPVPLDKVEATVENIVLGKVIAQNSEYDDAYEKIYTKNTVEVYTVFKGKAIDTIQVFTKGGSIGDEAQVYHPALRLTKGDMGAFFLTPYGDHSNHYKCYADLQGFYKYDIYRNKVSAPFYNYPSIEEFEKGLSQLTGQPNQLKAAFYPFQFAARTSATQNITGLSPLQIRAGASEVLTITGTGFGDIIGEVQFRNADLGGSNFLSADPYDIISWSDEEIQLYVPAYAGSGEVVVKRKDEQMLISVDELVIISSEISARFNEFPNRSFRPKLIDDDGQGGYTWIFNKDFAQNLEAYNAFQRSIDSWVCATNVSFLLSNRFTSIKSSSMRDGVNLVAYSTPQQAEELGVGILAITTSYFSGCDQSGALNVFVAEMDMTINSNYNWNFTEDTPDIDEFDFQGTVTHELGHAHNLGHVIQEGALMHFNTNIGESSATRDIDEDAIQAGILNYEYSKTGGICEDNTYVVDRECMDYSTTNQLGITEEVVAAYSITEGVYRVINHTYLESVRVYDIKGNLVLETEDREINIAHLKPGCYFVRISHGANSETYQTIVK